MAIKILPLLLLVSACGAGDRADAVSDGNTDPESVAPATVVDHRGVIAFLGTSLTAGYGLPEDEAFPALIQDRLDSIGLPFRVVNAGVSGETSAGGVRKLDWLLEQPIAVLVLELGANDGLRGLDVETMRANLQDIIDQTRGRHPASAIVIAGMEAPPNLGRRYTEAFRAAFVALAEANDASRIPFLLDGVAGVPELNQSDGIHPTRRGHEIITETVWRVLGPVVDSVAARDDLNRETGANP